jgi:hypothetical protein
MVSFACTTVNAETGARTRPAESAVFKPVLTIEAASLTTRERVGAGWTCAIDASPDPEGLCALISRRAAIRFGGWDGSGNSLDRLTRTSSLTEAVRGLSSVSPRPDLARAERDGSRWNSATAKKQTIKTLKTMLGPTWRFMAVRALVLSLDEERGALVVTIGCRGRRRESFSQYWAYSSDLFGEHNEALNVGIS